MKKLLLAVVTFFSLGVLWLIPPHVNAANLTVAVDMASNGTACEEPGSISPEELTFGYNDRVTIAFTNTQDDKLEVRNVPGGTFTVAGNSTVTRTFQAKGNFIYAAWNAESNCEKATGAVEVSGGWWIRIWPWALALIGSVLVVLLVSRAGRRTPRTPSADTTANK